MMWTGKTRAAVEAGEAALDAIVLEALTQAQEPLSAARISMSTGCSAAAIEKSLGRLEALDLARPVSEHRFRWEAVSFIPPAGHRDSEHYDPHTGNWSRTCVRDGQVVFWHLGRNDPPRET